jgi:gliotoxin/aspirochlorine/mycotoxins biosynthesis cytochrome P450 monooxygenase
MEWYDARNVRSIGFEQERRLMKCSVVSRPEDIQTVFRDSDKHSKAVNNDAGWLMGELLGKCVGLISGADWRNLHTVTAVPFSHRSSMTYVSDILRSVEAQFQEIAEKETLKKGVINPVADLRFIPFWIVADILYGNLDEEQRQTLIDLIPLREALFKRVMQGGATRSAWSQYLPSRTNKDLNDFKRRWAAFNKSAYEIAKSTKGMAPVIEMFDAVREGIVSLEQILQTLDEMLFLDVTMGGLSWNLLFLASNPEVQNEIRRSLPEPAGHNAAWEEYITSPSTLLAASVLESARLKPLAAFSVPQSAPTSRTIGDYVVPGGTNFIVDTHSLNIHNPYWGCDRDAFRPSRFLDRKATETRYQYWRFGFGPRQCMGKYVVDIVIRATLAHLVAHYRLGLQETSNWDKDPETWIAHPNTELRCEKLV